MATSCPQPGTVGVSCYPTPRPPASQRAGLRWEVHAAEEGLEAGVVRRGGTEIRALGLNPWEDKQLHWIVSVVTQ